MSKQLKENTTVENSKLEKIPATKTKKKNTITFVLVFLLIASFVGNLYLYQLNNKTNTSLADLSVQNLALQENVKSLEATNATLEADCAALKEEVAELAEKVGDFAPTEVNTPEDIEAKDNSNPGEYVPDYSSPEAQALRDGEKELPELHGGKGVTEDNTVVDW